MWLAFLDVQNRQDFTIFWNELVPLRMGCGKMKPVISSASHFPGSPICDPARDAFAGSRSEGELDHGLSASSL